MKFIITGLLSLVLSANIFANGIDKLTFYTEDFPPFNFKKDDKLTGFSTEIFGEMLKIIGSTKTTDAIKSVPWARAYGLISNQNDIMLYSMGRTAQRENLFKWVGPIAPLEIGLIGKKSKNIKINDWKEVNNYKIGSQKNDAGSQLLIKAGGDKSKFSIVASAKLYPKMLERDRVDLVPFNKTVLFWYMKQEGIDTSKYEMVKPLKQLTLNFAFSKNVSDETISALQGAFDKLKANGTVDKIINKYK